MLLLHQKEGENVKERIKKIRKELDLTQQEFAERIGIKRNTIANYETGRNDPVDSVISLICREFGVNEEWLRTGNGEMFNPAPTDVLDQLAQKYKLSNAAYIIIEKFVNLPPDKQAGLIDFCMEVSKAIIENDSDPNTTAFPERSYAGFSEDLAMQVFREIHNHQTVPKLSTEDNDNSLAKRDLEQMTVEEAEAAYIKSRLNSARKTTPFVSNTIEENTKKKNA